MAVGIHNQPPRHLQVLDFDTHPKKLFKLAVGFGLAAIPFSALVVLTSMSLRSDSIKALHGVAGKAILGISIPCSIICLVTAGIFKGKRDSEKVTTREERIAELEDIPTLDRVNEELGKVKKRIERRVKESEKEKIYNLESDTFTIMPEQVSDKNPKPIVKGDSIPEAFIEVAIEDEKDKKEFVKVNTRELRELLYDYQTLKLRRDFITNNPPVESDEEI